MLDIQPFLTAYDPTDLPGGSIDPLGFDRGYEWLAEKILPGLTNVASRPRYLSVYCAALVIAEDDVDLSGLERERRQQKREMMMQLERLWTLSCVLGGEAEPSIPESGIRGLRYVQAHVRKMRAGSDGSFKLLLQQARYGMLGIYGSLADKLKLVANADLQLTEPGRKLGEAFLQETRLPPAIRGAVWKPRTIDRDTLADWGRRAHVNGALGEKEAALLVELVEQDPTRERMCAHLQANPLHDGETELHRLERVAVVLNASTDQGLAEAVRAILAYENAYRSIVLTFQRVLLQCQSEPFRFDLAKASSDAVIPAMFANASAIHAQLDRAFSDASTAAFAQGSERAADVRGFVGDVAAAKTPSDFVATILERHRRVLNARVAGGRSKMPWLEVVDGVVKPTLAIAQQVRDNLDTPEAILAHPFRTFAADRFYGSGVAS